jgi:glutamine amidotransferase
VDCLCPDLAHEKERLVCRWLAYSGSPILVEKALYSPAHSLIDQSLHSKLGAEATNGDGFGVGWYDDQPTPGVFRSIEPAWNDQNLRELSAHVTSGLFFAHIRAAIGSAVQQTNCHPFRYGRWLFMHNGYVAELPRVKRDIALAIDESLYPEIAGGADTELLFYLALTLGLEDDPLDAVARAIGVVEDIGHKRGIKYPFQGTIATTDGERIWLFRYSSERKSRTLFFTKHIATLRQLYPERDVVFEVSEDARLVVSEPVGDLPGAWNEVPESSCGVAGAGDDQIRPFAVKPPTTSVAVGV